MPFRRSTAWSSPPSQPLRSEAGWTAQRTDYTARQPSGAAPTARPDPRIVPAGNECRSFVAPSGMRRSRSACSGDHPDSSVRNVVTYIRDRLEESETLQQAQTAPCSRSRRARTCTVNSSPR
ncbi:hypothetical protein GCM10022140_25590 [Rhodococcus aetherivorans]